MVIAGGGICSWRALQAMVELRFYSEYNGESMQD